jgi:hypothetical protein
MATSTFFNPFSSVKEQKVLDDLIVESIKHYGQDMLYLPRHNVDYDPLYGTSDLVRFSDTYEIEMYIKSNIDGFSGDGNFMSKFGLEIRDQITFIVARSTFDRYIKSVSKLKRPREGDLIYFPLNDKIFEIKFADDKPTFYQLGALQTYSLTCELYEYSSETFETGIPAIDIIQLKFSQDSYNNALKTEDGFILLTEANDVIEVNTIFDTDGLQINPNEDNLIVQNESDKFILFNEKNPFSDSGVV